jgi:ankyrin repeat protein
VLALILTSFLIIVLISECTTTPKPQVEVGRVSTQEFFRAVKDGDTAEVQGLIEAGVDVNAMDKNGNTALMCALYIGHTEIVELLISKGADVNAQNDYGYTALKTAL